MNEKFNWIREAFPDYRQLKPGEWSEYTKIFKYGSNDKEYVEVGLYREPDKEDEYYNTLTLQVFDGDSVIACHQVMIDENVD